MGEARALLPAVVLSAIVAAAAAAAAAPIVFDFTWFWNNTIVYLNPAATGVVVPSLNASTVNASEIYINGTDIFSFVASAVNYTALTAYLSSYTYNRSTVDAIVLGNASAVEAWVEANYYNKTTIDSWDLIKNYRLAGTLNASFNPIIDILYVNDPFKVRTADGRFVEFYFGGMADEAFNASALTLHPIWPGGVYNASYGVFIVNTTGGVMVGVGTDAPSKRLTVNGAGMFAGPVIDYFTVSKYHGPGNVRCSYTYSATAAPTTLYNLTAGDYVFTALVPNTISRIEFDVDGSRWLVNVTYTGGTNVWGTLIYRIHVESTGGIVAWPAPGAYVYLYSCLEQLS